MKPRNRNLRERFVPALAARVKKRKDAMGNFNPTEMSKEQRLAAGLRPRNPSKKDHWAQLTPSRLAIVLKNSRAHEARQHIMGVPPDQIYGPIAVIERGARWDEKLTTSTTID